MAGVKVGNALDGTGAHWAEVLHLIDLHAALLRGTIDTFALVSPTLEHADALCRGIEHALLLLIGDLAVVGHLRVRRRRNGCTLGHHVGPLALEIYQRSQVGLPRLGIRGIHALVGVVIEVFVTQAGIGMAKLMDHHLVEGGMVAGGDGQLVIDATAAIGVAVDQHDDVLKGDS